MFHRFCKLSLYFGGIFLRFRAFYLRWNLILFEHLKDDVVIYGSTMTELRLTTPKNTEEHRKRREKSKLEIFTKTVMRIENKNY